MKKILNYQDNDSFCLCDFRNPVHCQKLVELICHYMSDPMGDYPELDSKQAQYLVNGLADHPSCFVLFAKLNQQIVGLATCFVNFSTFRAKPYINLHDIIVFRNLRGQGLGRKLLEELILIGKANKYCKITLEVRDDNNNAKKLYSDLGFKDTNPMMHFWTKLL